MERLTIPDEPIEGGIRRAVVDARVVRKEAMKIYWALKKYEDIGLAPEQMREIDRLYAEKCRELAELQSRRISVEDLHQMSNYDPSIHDGIHTVRITLQQWNYTGHILQRVHGCCKGRVILDFNFEIEDEFPENDCELTYHKGSDTYTAVLKDKDGNTLMIEEDEGGMNDMIVAVEIINYTGRNDHETD